MRMLCASANIPRCVSVFIQKTIVPVKRHQFVLAMLREQHSMSETRNTRRIIIWTGKKSTPENRERRRKSISPRNLSIGSQPLAVDMWVCVCHTINDCILLCAPACVWMCTKRQFESSSFSWSFDGWTIAYRVAISIDCSEPTREPEKKQQQPNRNGKQTETTIYR